MNKENCALKLVDEIILYYDARSKKHQMKTYVHLWLYLPQFFLELEIFQNNFVEKIKTHFMFNIFF